jgi:hypothetical protein
VRFEVASLKAEYLDEEGSLDRRAQSSKKEDDIETCEETTVSMICLLRVNAQARDRTLVVLCSEPRRGDLPVLEEVCKRDQLAGTKKRILSYDLAQDVRWGSAHRHQRGWADRVAERQLRASAPEEAP